MGNRSAVLLGRVAGKAVTNTGPSGKVNGTTRLEIKTRLVPSGFDDGDIA